MQDVSGVFDTTSFSVVCFIGHHEGKSQWCHRTEYSCCDSPWFRPTPLALVSPPSHSVLDAMALALEEAVAAACRPLWLQEDRPGFFISIHAGAKLGSAVLPEALFGEGERRFQGSTDAVVHCLPEPLRTTVEEWRNVAKCGTPLPARAYVMGGREYSLLARYLREDADGISLNSKCKLVPEALFAVFCREEERLSSGGGAMAARKFWGLGQSSSASQQGGLASEMRSFCISAQGAKNENFRLGPLQQQAFCFFARKAGRAINASEMGTGKTATAVVCADFALQRSPFLQVRRRKKGSSDGDDRILSMYHPCRAAEVLPGKRPVPRFPRGSFWKRRFPCRMVLVVCLSSLKKMWQVEFSRFAPSIRVRILKTCADGASRDTRQHVLQSACEPDHAAAFLEEIKTAGREDNKGKPGSKKRKRPSAPTDSQISPCAVITSFASISSSEVQELAAHAAMVIFDESHSIKNPSSNRSKAALKISKKCPHVLLLSGTPGSKSMDLLPQLRAVSFHPEAFSQALPYHLRHGADAFFFGSRYCVPEFKSSYCRARTLAQVKLTTSCRQAELHALLALFCSRTRKGEALPDLPPKVRRQTVIHSLSAADRQYYNLELDKIAEVRERGGDKMAGCMLMELVRETAARKAELLQEHLASRCSAGDLGKHKTLFFAHHKVILAAIQEELLRQKQTFMVITGDTPSKTRQDLVDSFQEGAVDHAVLSIQAAGTGLNLFKANRVVICELIWSEQHLMQAEDRAHRRGVVGQVVVEYLVLRHSTDDLIWRSITKKSKTANYMIDNNNRSSLASVLRQRE